MDFNVSLRRAIRTGNVILGKNQALETVKEGKAKLVVVANNAPEDFREFLDDEQKKSVYVFQGSSVQLGMACGKPFMVSALAVTDEGDSDILDLVKA